MKRQREKEGGGEEGGSKAHEKGGAPRYDVRFALPSQEEQDHLRQTKNLFKSNLLKLEVDALLQQVRVVKGDESKKKASRQWKELSQLLFATKKCLEELKAKANVTPEQVGVSLSGWDTRNPAHAQLDFCPPTNVSVVGSFLLDTMTKANRSVDLAITMPDECFNRKDYLNYRYHDKRLLYLGYIAKSLANRKDLYSSVEFLGIFNDTSKPILVLRPAQSDDSLLQKFTVRVLPMVGSEVFPLSRFRPDQNNVRPLWLQKSQTDERHGEYEASPHYSMSVLEDVTTESSFKQQLVLLHHVQKICPSFSSACVLLKVWSRVHGISKESSPDTFHEGLLGLLLAHLILEKQISPSLSVQQIFRSTIAYIAKTDRLFVRLKPDQKSTAVVREGFEDRAFRTAFHVVFIGCCGRLNLAWRVSKRGWHAVQAEAQISHRLLEQHELSGGRDVFSAVFMGKVNLWQRYDDFMAVQIPEKMAKSVMRLQGLPGRSQDSSAHDSLVAEMCDLPCEMFLRRRLESIFARAFVQTGRAFELRVVANPERAKSWAIGGRPAKLCLLVCMRLDVTNAFRLLDKGPSAEDSEAAAAFRAFWGEKSELRRFQDGTILETLDWTSCTPETVCPTIAKHILGVQWPFGAAPPVKSRGIRVTVVGKQLERALSDLDEAHYRQSKMMAQANAFPKLFEAFERLSGHLKDLDLPLSIKSVSAADPALRYAATVKPNKHPLAFGRDDPERVRLLAEIENNHRSSNSGLKKRAKIQQPALHVSRLVDAVHVVLRLESSAQWPDDPQAIQEMKTAFYVQIAEQFEADKQVQGLQRCIAAKDCVEVLYQGYAFRLVLSIEKEIHLLRSPPRAFMGSISRVVAAKLRVKLGTAPTVAPTAKEMNEMQKNKIAKAAEIERSTIRAPLVHMQLHALHTSSDVTGGAHIMGPVTRLAKLWISGHLLWPHIREEAIELLVACVFLHPQPYQAPRSIGSGFLRFLSLLAHWDWLHEPLLVGLGDGFDAGTSAKLLEAFMSQRERAAGAHMFVMTPDDCLEADSANWKPYWSDRSRPSLDALSRMTSLAKDSLKLLNGLMAAQASGDYNAEMEHFWLAIFQSAPEQAGLDVVVSLHPSKSLHGLAVDGESAKSKKSKSVAKLYKNLTAEEKVYVGVNPVVSFARDLEDTFGHLFQIHFDPFRANYLGLKWQPGVRDPVALRVAVAGFARPTAATTKSKDSASNSRGDQLAVVPNVAEICSDIISIGEGIVSNCKVLGA